LVKKEWGKDGGELPLMGGKKGISLIGRTAAAFWKTIESQAPRRENGTSLLSEGEGNPRE